ncbi:hypothetical protein CRV002 [Nile crocodilepox virus]|uniref:Uncharacterized protein n=1 Tax=Nile crocodilepox virus (isolate Crocodylus niloticus/Zimbabwe/Ume/2001) TaxID=1289473 RepID=Q070P1_CPRVZ|nr:hypothetical protein CRV002 [Nile crocodilepox virus]ABJ08893.1 hypothetical protein CRV002 [Nile crocodilepox virus]
MASREDSGREPPAAAERDSASTAPPTENLDSDVDLDSDSDLLWSDGSLSLSSDESLDDASSLARWAASIIGFDGTTEQDRTLAQAWDNALINQRPAGQDADGAQPNAMLTYDEIRLITEEADAAADAWIAGGDHTPEHVVAAAREAAVAATRAAADAYRLGHMLAAAEAESAAVGAAGARSIAAAQVAEAILRTRLINGLVPEAALSAAAIAGSLEAARRSDNAEMLRMLGSARYAASAAVRLGVVVDAARFTRRADAFVTEVSSARARRNMFERRGHYGNLLRDAVLGIDPYASDNDDNADAFDPDPPPPPGFPELVPEIERCFVFDSGTRTIGARPSGAPIGSRQPLIIEITRESLDSEARFDARDREYGRRGRRRVERQRRAMDRRMYSLTRIGERPQSARSRRRQRRRARATAAADSAAISGDPSPQTTRARSPPRPHVVVCDAWRRGRTPPTIDIELLDASGRILLTRRLGGRGCAGASRARCAELVAQIHGSCFDAPATPDPRWPVAETLRITRTPAPAAERAAAAAAASASASFAAPAPASSPSSAASSAAAPARPRARSPPAFACYVVPRRRPALRAALEAALSPAAAPGSAAAGLPLARLRLPRPPRAPSSSSSSSAPSRALSSSAAAPAAARRSRSRSSSSSSSSRSSSSSSLSTSSSGSPGRSPPRSPSNPASSSSSSLPSFSFSLSSFAPISPARRLLLAVDADAAAVVAAASDASAAVAAAAPAAARRDRDRLRARSRSRSRSRSPL